MDPQAPTPAEWDAEGVPRSRRHGDIYFSTVDGLGETRTVFLQGCGLPDAWRGRRRFTVGEIGFGTGLNVIALLDLWRTHAAPDAHLHIFTIEADPLPVADAARALARWPELKEVADEILARWPGRAAGLHRIDLPGFRATLDVAVQEAQAALEDWRGAADAWFLDGFSPALNPDAWRPEVLAAVGQRSRPGARAATFTVAGHVRRGLEAAGFAVSRQPGFAGKRQRLEAVFPGEAADPPLAGPVAVIGAGIAGASLVRALKAQGADVRLFDAAGPGAGASGNPRGLMGPRLDAGFGPSARLAARAFARARRLYADIPDAAAPTGMLQLEQSPRDPRRFAAIAASDLFEPGDLACLDASAASGLAGDDTAGGLHVRSALTVTPARILAAWAGETETARISAIAPCPAGWRLVGTDGETLAEAAVVCLAAGWGLTEIEWPGEHPPLSPIRGQMSWAAGVTSPLGVGWGGYAAPGPDSLAFGATYDRGDTGVDHRPGDDLRNLANLARGLPRLAGRLDASPLQGRASIRAVTPDREPVAGAVPGAEGLYVLTGLGSRGFTNAPLLAEHVAALICQVPSPLAASQAAVVDPARFVA